MKKIYKGYIIVTTLLMLLCVIFSIIVRANKKIGISPYIFYYIVFGLFILLMIISFCFTRPYIIKLHEQFNKIMQDFSNKETNDYRVIKEELIQLKAKNYFELSFEFETTVTLVISICDLVLNNISSCYESLKSIDIEKILNSKLYKNDYTENYLLILFLLAIINKHDNNDELFEYYYNLYVNKKNDLIKCLNNDKTIEMFNEISSVFEEIKNNTLISLPEKSEIKILNLIFTTPFLKSFELKN